MLALDCGTRNVGLACCDELGVAVAPLRSIPFRGRAALIDEIRALIQKEGFGEIVIGLPRNMDGTEGPACERVKQFSRHLERTTALPTHLMDERLSTEEAKEVWTGLKPRQQRRYRTVDSLAAALILQRYLSEKR